MAEAYNRTTYDGMLTFNISAPANSGSYAQVYTLLSGAQQTELAGKLTVRMEMFSASAFNYINATPGNLSVIDPNGQAQAVIANQKPNEVIGLQMAEKWTYVRSASASPVTVSITLFYVNADSL